MAMGAVHNGTSPITATPGFHAPHVTSQPWSPLCRTLERRPELTCPLVIGPIIERSYIGCILGVWLTLHHQLLASTPWLALVCRACENLSMQASVFPNLCASVWLANLRLLNCHWRCIASRRPSDSQTRGVQDVRPSDRVSKPYCR